MRLGRCLRWRRFGGDGRESAHLHHTAVWPFAAGRAAGHRRQAPARVFIRLVGLIALAEKNREWNRPLQAPSACRPARAPVKTGFSSQLPAYASPSLRWSDPARRSRSPAACCPGIGELSPADRA